jgi:hypothetical protein
MNAKCQIIFIFLFFFMVKMVLTTEFHEILSPLIDTELTSDSDSDTGNDDDCEASILKPNETEILKPNETEILKPNEEAVRGRLLQNHMQEYVHLT